MITRSGTPSVVPEGGNGAKWTKSQTEVLRASYEKFAHVVAMGGLKQPNACSENMYNCGGLLAGRNIEDVVHNMAVTLPGEKDMPRKCSPGAGRARAAFLLE